MSQQKAKKHSNWMQCENCLAFLQNKDTECHSNDCPPSSEQNSYNFVRNHILHGTVDLKTNDEIKNISQFDRDSIVFLSESVIRMCSLAIGDWAIVENLDEQSIPHVAKMVWPNVEKSITSALFTKNGLELSSFKPGQRVTVRKLCPGIEASSISLVTLNSFKTLEFTPELHSRLSNSFCKKFLTVGNKIKIMFYGKELAFQIVSINSNKGTIEEGLKKMDLGDRNACEFYEVVSKTKWICHKNNDNYQESIENKKCDRPAGVEDEIVEIEELMTACLEKSLYRTRIKGILLYGHSGTGKTSIVNYIASKSEVNLLRLSPLELFSNNSTAEKYIKQLYEEAVDKAPTLVILEDFDIICPSKNSRLTEIEKKTNSLLLKLFDDVHSQRAKVFFIATSNKPDNIDPAFRRCGRLDREIEIPTPGPKSRQAILDNIFEQLNIDLDKRLCQDVSSNTHGFVGSDLVSLCSMATLNANRRNKSSLTKEDFEYALKRVRPSAMREVQIEIPNVKWSDIGGQEHLKTILKQAIEWPLKYPESFTRLGVTPPKGVLMFGPPGCSKTMIAKALACESGLNFLSIKGPELFSKWVGESERAVREVFRKARQVAPSIIFFDEIDALGGERGSNSGANVQERVLAQLLTELDGVTPLQDVTILAATNRPDRIDKALLRPGRLDRIVYVSLPDEQTRRDIFRIKLSKMPVSGVDIDTLVSETENYSGAEINAVCHEAAMLALEESLESEFVSRRHFEKALTLITPRTPLSLIKLYEDYLNKN